MNRLAVAVALIVVATALVAPGAAQSADAPTLTTSWANEQQNTVVLTLSEAPNGVSGYTINVSVDDDSSASITAIDTVSDAGPIMATSVADDGRSGTAKVADPGNLINAGDTGVDLLTVELENVEASTPPITLDDVEITDDTPEGNVVTVTVDRSTAVKTPVTQTAAPTTEASGPGPGALVAVLAVTAGALAITRRP